MAVDRADVLEAERAEERRQRRRRRSLDGGEARHGGRVAAAVVVQDDHDAPAAVPEVVQRFVREAAGERAVADDRDDVGVGIGGTRVAGDREPVRVADRGGGVAVLDDVVLGLGAGRVARHPAGLAEPREAVAPPGDQLVHVGLVAGVPHDCVARRVEDPVQRERELDRPEVGAEVPAARGDRVDQDGTDLGCKLPQLVSIEMLQVSRAVDVVEEHAVLPLRPPVSPLGRGDATWVGRAAAGPPSPLGDVERGRRSTAQHVPNQWEGTRDRDSQHLREHRRAGAALPCLPDRDISRDLAADAVLRQRRGRPELLGGAPPRRGREPHHRCRFVGRLQALTDRDGRASSPATGELAVPSSGSRAWSCRCRRLRSRPP